jgi:hypothetical protein
MRIEIKSDLPFDEGTCDAAFGFAKRMIINGVRCKAVSRRKGFVLSATLKPRKSSIVVTIHKEPAG